MNHNLELRLSKRQKTDKRIKSVIPKYKKILVITTNERFTVPLDHIASCGYTFINNSNVPTTYITIEYLRS